MTYVFIMNSSACRLKRLKRRAGVVGYHVRLTRERSAVRSRCAILFTIPAPAGTIFCRMSKARFSTRKSGNRESGFPIPGPPFPKSRDRVFNSKAAFLEVHTHARGALERGHVPKVRFVFLGFLCGVLRGHRRGLEHFVAAVLPKDPICALKLGDRTSPTANLRGSSAGLRRARIFSAAGPPVHWGVDPARTFFLRVY